MKNHLQKLLQKILKDMGADGIVPVVEISDDSSHGEYTTNVAMRLSKQLKMSPMEIALQVADSMKRQVSSVKQEESDQKIHKNNQNISDKKSSIDMLQAIDRVEVVPPGFINIFVGEASATVGSGGGMMTVTDAEVASVAGKNLIVVGGSAINSVAAELLGGAYRGDAFTATTGIGAGQFLIGSYSRGGNVALLVAGYEAADTAKAADYLVNNAVDTTVGKMIKKFPANPRESSRIKLVCQPLFVEIRVDSRASL